MWRSRYIGQNLIFILVAVRAAHSGQPFVVGASKYIHSVGHGRVANSHKVCIGVAVQAARVPEYASDDLKGLDRARVLLLGQRLARCTCRDANNKQGESQEGSSGNGFHESLLLCDWGEWRA